MMARASSYMGCPEMTVQETPPSSSSPLCRSPKTKRPCLYFRELLTSGCPLGCLPSGRLVGCQRAKWCAQPPPLVARGSHPAEAQFFFLHAFLGFFSVFGFCLIFPRFSLKKYFFSREAHRVKAQFVLHGEAQLCFRMKRFPKVKNIVVVLKSEKHNCAF